MKSECTVTGISNANSLRLPWSIQPTKTSFPLYADNSITYQPDGWGGHDCLLISKLHFPFLMKNGQMQNNLPS